MYKRRTPIENVWIKSPIQEIVIYYHEWLNIFLTFFLADLDYHLMAASLMYILFHIKVNSIKVYS